MLDQAIADARAGKKVLVIGHTQGFVTDYMFHYIKSQMSFEELGRFFVPSGTRLMFLCSVGEAPRTLMGRRFDAVYEDHACYEGSTSEDYDRMSSAVMANQRYINEEEGKG